jgi:hypothetical protein
MPRTYNIADVQCPFFIACGKTSITCEGITDECVTRILFDKENNRDKHRFQFCDKQYRNCKIYELLVKKYE